MKKHRELIMFVILAAAFTAIVIINKMKTGNGEQEASVYIPTVRQTQSAENQTIDPENDVTVKEAEADRVTFTRQAEYLDRAPVAIKTEDGVFLSWRFLGTDEAAVAFNIYRDGQRITDKPIADRTNYTDKGGTTDASYYIEAVLGDKMLDKTQAIKVLSGNYLDIPISAPDKKTMPDGTSCTYSANDASVGDVDGDGQYEIILKWDPSNAQDNSKDGYTGNVYIDAYEMDGTKLWRIDLGVNIRAGAHYTQFMVYDLDGDARAELVCKTADGTVDGQGNVIGDGTADYRTEAGRILSGPEYLTLFDGQTGAALDTIDYEPERGSVTSWGDSYGNRVDRFLAAVAYLDGEKPSVIMCRGYYTRAVLASYDVQDKKLIKRWVFDSKESGNGAYAGQGNHNLAVADVDWDGKDEIVYGQCVIDDDGTGLVSTGLGHGDAIHVGDYLPERAGIEAWGCLEASHGAALWDAATGEVLLRIPAKDDTGRAIAGNFIAGNNGAEFVSVASDIIYDGNGLMMGSWMKYTKSYPNYAVYWDGDLEQEILDKTMIDKYGTGRIFTAPGVTSINGTKSNSSLCADILGDWREEIMWPTADGSALRIYTTTEETTSRVFTLMHDTQYRCQVASQNVAYNQGAAPSFFLGTGFELPSQPDIAVVRLEK